MHDRRLLAGTCLALCLLPLADADAGAEELLYRWKAGEIHRFRMEEMSTVQLAGMAGMGMAAVPGANMSSAVTSTFAEKVLRVRPDGTAEIELTIEQLLVGQPGGGAPVNALSLLPAAARKVKAEVDAKGNARFYRVVTIYQLEDRLVVGGYASAGKGRAAVSATGTTPDGQKVELYGSVDVRTGKVTAGAKVGSAAPAMKAVQVKAEDPSIEVVPRRLFELMVLPSGDCAPGSSVDVDNPLGRLRVACEPHEAAVAPIHVTTVVAAAAATGGAHAEAEAEAEGGAEAGMAMPAGMGGMGGMGMGMTSGGGAGGGGGGGGASSVMRMNVDLRSRFDLAAGRLLEIRGTMKMSTGMGDGAGKGAGVSIDSQLNLTHL